MTRRAQIAAYIMLLLGVLATLLLMAHYGFDAIGDALSVGGWGILLICLWRMIPLAFDAIGWHTLFHGTWKTKLYKPFWFRWIGESVNTLLPVGQLGGDVVRARLAIKDGAGGALTGATSIFDVILGLCAQATLAVAALGLVLALHSMDDLVVALTLSTVAVAGAIYVLFWLPRIGAVTVLVRMATSWSDNPSVQMVNGRAARVQAAIMDLYDRRWMLFAAYFWRVGACVLRVFETWFALKILGYDIGFEEALIIESLINLVRSVSFVIPGGLGVQEGGMVLFGSIVGLSPEVALALAVVKRMREVVVGLPALLGWTAMEAKGMHGWLLRRKRASQGMHHGPAVAAQLPIDHAQRGPAE
ncbi:MAG: flippase-like domain-containing protein [Alphaproteobacteria bacterium]|nr:flippase-like domain-containing protein [Alphaproteobacteria bacterium]